MSSTKFGKESSFDSDLYGDEHPDKYLSYIPDDKDDDEPDLEINSNSSNLPKRNSINASSDLLHADDEVDDNMDAYRQRYGSGVANTKISARENEVSSIITNAFLYQIKNLNAI